MTIIDRKKSKEYYKNHPRFIYNLDETSKKSAIGNKAQNLRFLQKKNFNIPLTYVCNFEAFDLYRRRSINLISNLKQELKFYIEDEKSYSIRSSANIEDESFKSFAGQFQTILNRKGIDDISESIIKVWKSHEDVKPQTYSKMFSQNPNQIKMGVIIQEMVNPQFSGVIFTRNPLTGLDEVIIESVDGLGENLVQVGVTPERWVYKWGDWIEKPHAASNKEKIIDRIVQESIKITKKYGVPLDLEWAFDGDNIYWLQLRQITTIKDAKIYSNKLSREMMPGMIKPLIWSVNTGMVNPSWKHIFEQLIGAPAKKIDINELARPFYYRSYFNMKIMGDIFELLGMRRDLLETLAGIESEGKDKPTFKPSGKTFIYLPRIIIFCLKLYSFSRTIERFLHSHPDKYGKITKTSTSNLDENDCLGVINNLFELNIRASYIVVITQLLNSFYNRLIKNKLKKKNIKFEDIDFTIYNKRIKFSDPRCRISHLHKEFQKLNIFDRKNVADIKYEDLLREYGDSKFTKDFHEFVSKFGFFRDSQNDFSQPPWEENPDLMLKMVIDYKEPELKDCDESDLKTIKKDIFKSPFSKIIFNRAVKYLEYRQTVTKLYSYGYGLFRIYFLRIADLLVLKGLMDTRDDIFYLNYEEVQELIKDNGNAEAFRRSISKRKSEMVMYRNLQLPDIIYDDFLPKPISHTALIKELKGVPTSKGVYTGPVKVVKGLNDIDKIKEGDIIAIPFSDVSWTPLFAKVKAVISESGGMLSHCSIVAREYKIPAVVSVNGATLLKDNTFIEVNAYNGRISVLKEPSITEEELEKSLIQ